MTRADEDIEGVAPKIFRYLKEGLRKFVYFITTRRGAPKNNIEPLARGGGGGLLEFQASSFNIFIPLVILN